MSIKKVRGNKSNQWYHIDEANAIYKSDGTDYSVKENKNIRVYTYINPTKQKEMDLNKKIRSGVSGNVRILELVTSKGRFLGYAYRIETALQPEIDTSNNQALQNNSSNSGYEISNGKKENSHDRNGNLRKGNLRSRNKDTRERNGRLKDSFLDSIWFCAIASIIMGALLFFLNIGMLNDIYLFIIGNEFTDDVLSGCITFSLSGITGGVVGLALMIICFVLIGKKISGVLLLILELGAYFIGVVFADLVLTILVILVIGVYSLVIILLPTIILIGLLYFIFIKK